MAEHLLSIGEVTGRVGLARATVYRRMATGQFPAPLALGPQTVRWRESDIEAWIAALPSARPGLTVQPILPSRPCASARSAPAEARR